MATRRKTTVTTEERDLKKPGTRRAGRTFLTESVRLTGQTAAIFWGGVADSVAQAFDAVDRALEPENVDRTGIADGIVDGILAGNARFFEGMAETSREILDETRESRTTARDRETVETRVEEIVIDYDRLAKLVADELEKRAPHDTTT